MYYSFATIKSQSLCNYNVWYVFRRHCSFSPRLPSLVLCQSSFECYMYHMQLHSQDPFCLESSQVFLQTCYFRHLVARSLCLLMFYNLVLPLLVTNMAHMRSSISRPVIPLFTGTISRWLQVAFPLPLPLPETPAFPPFCMYKDLKFETLVQHALFT